MIKGQGREQIATLTKKCFDCGGTMQGRRENYNYTESGLRSLVLMNVVVFHCAKCGAIVPEIPAVEKLHRAVALDLLTKNTLLSPEEIRFVRKVSGYTATQLAAVMGVNKVSVSRWEGGARPIGKESDRLLRLLFFARMVERMWKDGSSAVDQSKISEVFSALKLTELLGAIEGRSSDSKRLRIDPATLGFAGCEVCEEVEVQ